MVMQSLLLGTGITILCKHLYIHKPRVPTIIGKPYTIPITSTQSNFIKPLYSKLQNRDRLSVAAEQ